MNRIKKMKRGIIAALAVVFFLGLAGYASAQIIPPPPEGDDTFDSLAHNVLVFTSKEFPPRIEIDVVGSTRIHRFQPNPQRIIRTEMRSLNLTGGGSADDVFFDVSVGLRPDRPSDGEINANTGISFFNVWPRFRVSRGGEEVGVFQTTQSVRLEATIRAIPPIETAYIPPRPEPVPLVDLDGNPVGFLTHVQHVPAQPSNAKIKRELIAIEKKLDRLLTAIGAPNKTAAPVVKPEGKPKEKAESQTSAPAESNDRKPLAKNQ